MSRFSVTDASAWMQPGEDLEKKWGGIKSLKGSRRDCGGRLEVVLLLGIFSIGLVIEPTGAAPLQENQEETFLGSQGLSLDKKDLNLPTFKMAQGLPSPENCTEPSIKDFPKDLFSQAQLEHGAFLFHVIASAYIFYAIAYLCEVFFVPSVESLCKALHVPSDVGGATFMAIATSSPEFFTNVIGTFVTEGDIGVGSVVGSVVFNLLAIVSWCGLIVPHGLKLDWWPLTRDCAFYVFSVISLIQVLWDGRIYWNEALYFVGLYIIYLIVICKNQAIQKFIEKRCESGYRPAPVSAERLRELIVSSLSYGDGFKSSDETTPLLSDKSGRYVLQPQISSGPAGEPQIRRSKSQDKLLPPFIPIVKTDGKPEDIRRSPRLENISECSASGESGIHTDSKDEPQLSEFPWSQGALAWLKCIGTWPVRWILHVTVPNCGSPRFRNWYPLTFAMCILYMAVFSYLITWMMTVIGHSVGVPDAVMGLTFIAAGTSLPEALSSVIVAKQGLGTMSISNSVGSNTFNILLCLGLPWLIRTLIMTGKGAAGGATFVLMTTGGFGYISIFLLASALILYSLIALNGFYLDKRIGFVALGMYFLFLLFALLLEMNLFFPVNFPTCPLH